MDSELNTGYFEKDDKYPLNLQTPPNIPKAYDLPKLLRTSRYFPYFTILRNVIGIPNDLTNLELRKLAEYLADNKEIQITEYTELVKLVYPAPKIQRMSSPNSPSRPHSPIRPHSLHSPHSPHIPHSPHSPHIPHSPHSPIRPVNPFYSDTPCSDVECISPVHLVSPHCIVQTFVNYDDDIALEQEYGYNNYSSLNRIKNLPTDLDDEELERLSDYMDTHSDIDIISFYELVNRIEPRSPKRRCVNK